MKVVICNQDRRDQALAHLAANNRFHDQDGYTRRVHDIPFLEALASYHAVEVIPRSTPKCWHSKDSSEPFLYYVGS